jgi:DNA-binding GntR family transcriptional regulator
LALNLQNPRCEPDDKREGSSEKCLSKQNGRQITAIKSIEFSRFLYSDQYMKLWLIKKCIQFEYSIDRDDEAEPSLSKMVAMISLYQQTYRALRQEILCGQLSSGDRLIEERLAQRLAISRTPVREALRQLQREGLIQADQRGGLRVTTLSIADAIQLYDCRLGLEQIAAIGACENATPQQLEGLQQCLAQAQALAQQPLQRGAPDEVNPPQSGEQDHRLTVDQDFHHLLAESSGNPWLVGLLDQVFGKMALLRLTTTHRNPEVLEIWNEHEQIVTAIGQRDPQAAAAAVHHHLVSSKARVVQELQGLHSSNPAYAISIQSSP